MRPWSLVQFFFTVVSQQQKTRSPRRVYQADKLTTVTRVAELTRWGLQKGIGTTSLE